MFGLEMTKTSTMDALYRRLRRAEAEREEYRTRCEEVLHGQGQSVNWLIRALDHEREVSRKLTDTLHGSEEQRRQLCRKLGDREAELSKTEEEVRRLKTEIGQQVEAHEQLLDQVDELRGDYERALSELAALREVYGAEPSADRPEARLEEGEDFR